MPPHDMHFGALDITNSDAHMRIRTTLHMVMLVRLSESTTLNPKP